MSNTVDRRIVEMQFDNKDFEKNVGNTLISLETLKKALEMNDGSKGLEQVADATKNIDLSKIEAGAAACEKHFSTLGIVAATVIENLTDKAMHAASSLAGTFLGPLFSGGKQRASNMAQAKFMFAGLKYGADEIGAVGKSGTIMDNLYKSVEGTFYSLDKAALVGSQLMAAGIKGTGDELTKYMRGIAGVASVYSADYQRVGEIFAQTAATGHLTGRELESFRSMSVPVLQVLSDYFKETGDGAKYTQEEIQQMVSKGKIDFETFASAMDLAFGEQAQKSKQLFTGAFEDMSAAMARIGEKIWTPLIGAGGLGTKFFNAVVPVIDNINSKLTPAFTLWGKAIEGVSNKLMPFIDAFGALFDYENTLNELVRLSSDKLKDVDGNYLVDPERVKILKQHKHQIDAIRDSVKSVVKPFEDFHNAVRILFKNDFSNDAMIRANGLGIAMEKLQVVKKVGLAFQTAGVFLERFNKAVRILVARDFSKEAVIQARLWGLTADEISHIKDIVSGITSVVNIFRNVFSSAASTISDALFKITGAVFEDTSLFRLFFDVILSALAALGRFLSMLEYPISSVISLLLDFGSGLAGLFGGAGNAFRAFAEELKSLLSGLNLSFNNFGETALTVLRQIGAFLSGSISTMFGMLAKSVGGFGKALTTAFKGATLATLATGLWNIARAIQNFFYTMRKSGLTNLAVGEVFNETRLALIGLQNTLQVYQNTIKANVILKIAVAIGILAAAVKVLSNINPTRLTTATLAISTLFSELIASTLYLKPTASSGLIQLAGAVRILAGAVKMIGEMKVEDIVKGVAAVGILLGLMALISEKMAILEKTKTLQGKGAASLSKYILPLIGMAVAIKLLVKPVQELGSMDADDLAKGIISVGVLLAGMVGAMVVFSKYIEESQTGINAFLGRKGQMYSLVVSLLMLSIGINLLAKPVKELGGLSVDSLEKGLGSVAIMLSEIAAFITVFDTISIENPTSLLKLGGMMMMLGLAMKLLAKPVQDLAKLNAEQLVKGLGSIGVILAEIVVFAGFMNAFDAKGAEFLKAGAALVVMSIGIKIVADALNTISKIGNVGPALSTLFGALLILGTAMYAMQNAVTGAAAMIIVAGALAIMAPALLTLSLVDAMKAAGGLLALAGALTVLGLAAAIFTSSGLVIGLLALGGAVALVGVGVLALAAGMTMLATAFAVGAQPIVEGAKIIAQAFPVIAKGVAEGIVTIIQTIGDSAEAIKIAFMQIVDALLSVLLIAVPRIANVGLKLILALLMGINQNIKQITMTAVNIIANFIDGLAEGMPRLVESGFNLMISFLNSMADAISQNGDALATAFTDVLLAALGAVVGLIPGFGKQAKKAIDNYRDGLKSGQDSTAKAAKSIANTASTNMQIKDQKSNGSSAVRGIKSGIDSLNGQIRTSSKSIANTADTNLQVKDQKSNGANAVRGLKQGMESMKGSLRTAANAIADIVDKAIRKKNEMHSPSRRLARTGRQLMEGLINGVDSLSGQYQRKADNIATTMISSATRSANAVSSIMNSSFSDGFDLNSTVNKAMDVSVSMDKLNDRNSELNSKLEKLAGSLDTMTESMNSRSLNVYNTIDGSSDPEAFADGLIRSFRLNARAV